MTKSMLRPATAQYLHKPSRKRYISGTPTPAFAAVWIDPSNVTSYPNFGTPWTAINNRANATWGTADVSNQDSTHSRMVLAGAYVGMRNSNATMITKATNGLTAMIGTEAPARWLAIGRNLGAAIIAADVLNIRSGPIYNWLASFTTMVLENNNNSSILETIDETAWLSASNADAQVGFVYTALGAYLQDRDILDWNYRALRRYAGDRTSTWTMTSNNNSWQEIPADPVAIQNLGALATNGANIDGVVSNDMSRSNAVATNTPVYTSDSLYPWVGLNGSVFAALVLHRQGYPTFSLEDEAFRRAFDYLHNLGGLWYDGTEKPDVKWILNQAYGLNYDVVSPVDRVALVGYTDWSHPAGIG
jgi:hypothetical protein